MSKTLALRALGALLAAVVALSSSVALADAVGPPPESCPPGSTPQSSHAGPLCVPLGECSSSTECSAGATCEAVSQCVETRDCGGLRPPDSGPCTVDHVVGACGEGSTCAVGTCRTRRVCTTASASSDGGCSCRVAGAPSGPSPLAVAAMLVGGLAVGARSRRRAGSRARHHDAF
ncbi:MAG: MYXO-CTERM sorting domain-containing protein [Myxococcota bacterium]|nr:MYXO-CTERM sorting domain-containing protein [Myxococcota bacterium]